jgi:hypothetical protein
VLVVDSIDRLFGVLSFENSPEIWAAREAGSFIVDFLGSTFHAWPG